MWEERIAEAWRRIDEFEPDDFRRLIDELAAEMPAGSPEATFERASAFESTGHPDQAVPLYREALARGVSGERRRRATIQLASSLRNLGRPQESVTLLEEELARGSDHLDDAVKAVLALALADAGREREAVSLLLGALAPHLPRYQRSMADYARQLVAKE